VEAGYGDIRHKVLGMLPHKGKITQERSARMAVKNAFLTGDSTEK